MNKLLSTLCLLLFTHSSYGSKIPLKYRQILCDNQKLLNQAKTPTERIQMEESYLQLLGVLEELAGYRQNFLAHGNLIDLFPTAYYHTTLSEMVDIADNDFSYPMEKMDQMIAFYDAYQRNRLHWEANRAHLVEPHWQKHFYEASSGAHNIINFGCSGIPAALESGIIAHVEYDLPRAIRYAYENRKNKNLTKNDLIEDFNKTDRIFSHTNQNTKADIATIRSCTVWWQNVGEFFLGWLFKTDGDVVRMRKEAWIQAHSGLPIKGIDGYEMQSQPFTNHNELLAKGSKMCAQKANATLFLFDLSGSMNERGVNSNKSKLQQAKEASKSTLSTMLNTNSGTTNEVGALGFSGGCSSDPTRLISNFETNLSLVESRINTMGAGGGTPLAEAIAAAECKLANHLVQTGLDKGRLIILSDGQATCQPIRPNGVYNSGQLGQQIITVASNQCGNSSNFQEPNVKYFTIGFNIAPGSPAERDLQYLSSSTGGKYLNVQNQIQLTRAFRKFSRTYRPKEYPSLSGISEESINKFRKGVFEIKAESFKNALKANIAFANTHPNDPNGIYNLALAQEANDYYWDAIKSYRQYLVLHPNADDKIFVTQQLIRLEEEFKDFVVFQKEVIRSDLEFLKIHFERIQHGQSVALAMEFRGFLQEKGSYYDDLPYLIGNTSRSFSGLSQDIAAAFQQCAQMIRRKPETWDRDAVPAISMTYLNLKELLEEL